MKEFVEAVVEPQEVLHVDLYIYDCESVSSQSGPQ